MGKVMVAGGYGKEGIGRLKSVELYDVAKEQWEGGTAMTTARSSHGMVFLPDVGARGAVMVAAGRAEGGAGRRAERGAYPGREEPAALPASRAPQLRQADARCVPRIQGVVSGTSLELEAAS